MLPVRCTLMREECRHERANTTSAVGSLVVRQRSVFFAQRRRGSMSQPVALVTGANKGIGFEVARRLAKAGYVVLLGARNPMTGREAADTLRSERLDVRFVELDVTRSETISLAAGRIEADFGKLDVLVNNAGIADPNDGPPSRASVDAIERVLRTNFLGAVAVAQAVLPLLKKSEAGRIVNVSSELGSITGAWQSKVEVRAGEGVGLLRVEGRAEHVHRRIGLRAQGSGYCGELGQSGLHRDRPECTQGRADRREGSGRSRARRVPRAWTEREVPGKRP